MALIKPRRWFDSTPAYYEQQDTQRVFNLDKRVSDLLSPEALKKIEGITLNDATLQETLQKKGKIPYDYANQTAMKYVVGQFQNIRGPQSR